MLSLDKIKKGISEISESGGIKTIGDNIKSGIGNIRNSVTAGISNLRNTARTIGRQNLFSNSPASRTMTASSSSRQKVRPGKLSLYVKNISTKRLSVPIKCVGSNIKSTLENILRSNIEGKCSIEGYVKPRSCNVITYSCGLVTGSIAIFTVVFECLVCNPAQGMRISCTVKNITNAGILAHADDSEYSPVNIFIARDHHYNIPYFSELKEGDVIMIRVIGQRFELNDAFVSVLGELELEREREPRNSLRREIEMSQREKKTKEGKGILSTILEETGLSEKPAEGEAVEAAEEEAEEAEEAEEPEQAEEVEEAPAPEEGEE